MVESINAYAALVAVLRAALDLKLAVSAKITTFLVWPRVGQKMRLYDRAGHDKPKTENES